MIRQFNSWLLSNAFIAQEGAVKPAHPLIVSSVNGKATAQNDSAKTGWLKVTQAPRQITILHIQANLDGSTYEAVIEKGVELARAGTQCLLVDLSGVSKLSNAGLVALHNLARVMGGEPPTNTEDGWGALHAMAWDRQQGLQRRVKLLCPQPQVLDVSVQTKMNDFFEIYEDAQAAGASF